MTDWTHRAMIVSAAIAPQARALAAQMPSGAGMWTTPLSATGQAPATHYISAGLIGQEFAAMLESPQALVDGCAALGLPIDLAAATYLLSQADVSTEDGHTAMDRLGLQMVQEAQ
jgi:hypothetical protein